MADQIDEDYGGRKASLPVAVEQAAETMYSTYCGLMNCRGLMPIWHDLHSKIKANWVRMAEAAWESFKRNGL